MMGRKKKQLAREQVEAIVAKVLSLADYKKLIDRTVYETSAAYYWQKEIAEAIQFKFFFKAKTYANALNWYGSEISDTDPAHNFALLHIASIPSKKSRILFEEWKEKHLSLEQIRQRKKELTARAPRKAKDAADDSKELLDWMDYADNAAMVFRSLFVDKADKPIHAKLHIRDAIRARR